MCNYSEPVIRETESDLYMSDMKINIMIADDHILFREGMKKLMESNSEIQIVLESEDGEDCLEQLENTEENIDLLLLDISMPKKDGIEVLKALKEKKSEVRVFILTAHDEIEYLVNAVDLGVNGFALKTVTYS